MACGSAFRRNVFSGVHFRGYICGEDRLFVLETVLAAQSVVLLDVVLYGYRVRPMSYSTYGIRSFKGWRDELLYRVTFLKIVEASRKKIDLGRNDWLTSFLCFVFCIINFKICLHIFYF